MMSEEEGRRIGLYLGILILTLIYVLLPIEISFMWVMGRGNYVKSDIGRYLYILFVLAALVALPWFLPRHRTRTRNPSSQ